MLTNFRYRQFLVSLDNNTGELSATHCISISEAKRRNRKTRWPVVENFKFPADALIVQDTKRTPREAS